MVEFIDQDGPALKRSLSRRVQDLVAPQRTILIGGGVLFAVLFLFAGLPLSWSVASYLGISVLALFREPIVERHNRRLVDRTRAQSRDQAIARLIDMTNALPNAAFLLEGDGTAIVQNLTATKLTGLLRPGEHISNALRNPSVLQALEQTVQTCEPRTVTYFERVPINRSFQVHSAPLPAIDRNNSRTQYVLLLVDDLTKQQQIEKMRADFVANASHELRTPLASLLGFIETLQGNARDDPDARHKFLEIMRQQANRMTRLIADLMSLSRIESNAHVTPGDLVDLREVIRHVCDSLDPMAKAAGVTLSLDLPEELDLHLMGDRDELTQVFQNLMENAIKYGQSGERVEIKARAKAGNGHRFHVGVRDHGPGIADEHVPRLTERFYRVDVAESRDKGGTGLGLAIVKHILYRHRAFLTVSSKPGEGAEFSVEFSGHRDSIETAD